jgi:5-methylcytosine-specific restriction endonuclease McrA
MSIEATSCLHCGNQLDEDAQFYYVRQRGLEICEGCAQVVANVYCHRRSGEYLDWPSDRIKAPPVKTPIPSALRLAVLERDDFHCLRCGFRDQLCADHVIPESAGGETTLDNLQTLCRSCNSRKGITTHDYRIAANG